MIWSSINDIFEDFTIDQSVRFMNKFDLLVLKYCAAECSDMWVEQGGLVEKMDPG